MVRYRYLIPVVLLLILLSACGSAPRARWQIDITALGEHAAAVDSINCCKGLSLEQRKKSLLKLYQKSDAVVRFASINRYGSLFVWYKDPVFKGRRTLIDVPPCEHYSENKTPTLLQPSQVK